MIIGINGYIGSGKDETGKIIQYFDCKKRYNLDYDFKDFIAFNHSDWEIKKFAGKLKQIASLLTGIPIEKFEDQEFKKKTFKQLVDEGYLDKDFIKLLSNVNL
jgi:hypothetical protein